MKPQFWTILAVSYFTTLGNGQDGALAPTIVRGGSGPGVQGSVGWTQAQQEAELARAALAARQKKALMGAMASLSHKPPVITSAEQYLQVYRPAVASSPVGSALTAEAVRSSHYVPAFETGETVASGEGRASATGPAPAVGLPARKTGLFALFQSKESGIGGDLLKNPEPSGEAGSAAFGVEPPVVGPNSGSESPPTEVAVSNESAPSVDLPTEKPTFLGRLFGKSKASGSLPMPDPGGSTPPVIASPEWPPSTVDPVSTDIPAPPSFSAEAPAPAPAPAASGSDEESSIFLKRPRNTDSGTRATVMTTSQATVSGVLVRLYEGSSVSVLERSGSMARIRLADGREGTVAASALSR